MPTERSLKDGDNVILIVMKHVPPRAAYLRGLVILTGSPSSCDYGWISAFRFTQTLLMTIRASVSALGPNLGRPELTNEYRLNPHDTIAKRNRKRLQLMGFTKASVLSFHPGISIVRLNLIFKHFLS